VTGGTTTASLSDPVTLKVTAPTPISPINNQKADVLVLTATAAAGKFVPLGPLRYRFLIIGPTGAVIQDLGAAAVTQLRRRRDDGGRQGPHVGRPRGVSGSGWPLVGPGIVHRVEHARLYSWY